MQVLTAKLYETMETTIYLNIWKRNQHTQYMVSRYIRFLLPNLKDIIAVKLVEELDIEKS